MAQTSPEAPKLQYREIERPIANANPTIRHKKMILFPTRLSFARREGSLLIGFDKRKAKAVEISVGLNMAIGYQYDILLYGFRQARAGKPRALWGSIAGTDLTHQEVSINDLLPSEDNLLPGMQYVVDVRLEVFETDVLPGSMSWPGGRYKVLFRDSLEKIITPAPAMPRPAPAGTPAH